MIKKVLVFAFEFPPIRASNDRTYHLCRFLPKLGWKPIVISPLKATRWLPSDDSIVVTSEIERHDAPALDNFFVYFGRTFMGMFPDRNLYFFSCYRTGLEVLKKQGDTIDVVYASTPPVSSLFAAYLLAKKFRKPLILDFRDPYFPFGFLRGSYKKLLREAHRVITTTDIYRINLIEQGSDPSKTVVIPNGTDLSLIQSIKAEGIQKDPIFTIIYAGAYFKTYRIRELVEMALQLRSMNIKFVVVGDPDEGEDGLIKFVRDHQLHNVEFKGRLTQKDAIRELLKASIAYNGSNHPGGVGGKVYDYLACGLPILGFNELGSASERFINLYKVGWTFNKVAAVLETLVRLSGSIQEVSEYQQRALETARQFDRGNIAKKFVDVLNHSV